MDYVDVFRKLSKACDDIVKAYESGDAAETENALGRFMLLMVQLDALK